MRQGPDCRFLTACPVAGALWRSLGLSLSPLSLFLSLCLSLSLSLCLSLSLSGFVGSHLVFPRRVIQTMGEHWPCVLIFVEGALIIKQKLNDNYNDGNHTSVVRCRNILFLSCLNSTKWSVLITWGGLRGSGKSSSVLCYNSPRWGRAVPHSLSSIIFTKS